METTGTNPFDCHIVTIQVRSKGQTTIWPEWKLGETGCIESFFDYQRSIPRSETTFVGYNVLKFDVAFLDERLRQLEIMNEWKWRVLHDWTHWVDLYQLLGDAYYRGSTWYASLAGSRQSVTNAEIPELYKKGMYESIIEYIEKEMESMERTYSGLQKEPFYSELTKLRNKVLSV